MKSLNISGRAERQWGGRARNTFGIAERKARNVYDQAAPPSKWRYERVNIGGGGYVTGMRIAGRGSAKVRVCRTDTAGGFLWDGSEARWRPLLQAGINLSPEIMRYQYPRGAGCYDVAIAPSLTDCIYICQGGFVYATADRANSWRRTSLPYYDGYGANNGSRMTNERLAVDPGDHRIVAIGNPDTGARGGLHISVDGGETWARHRDIPAPAAAERGMAICFDPDSATTAGTAIVYVWSYGQGIYRSISGVRGRFVHIPEGPADISHMVARGGVLWTAGTSQGEGAPLRRWNEDTGWTVVPGVPDAKHIAISADAKKIVSMIASSAYRLSVDGGANFGPLTPRIRRQAVHIGWHETTNENYMSNGACVWDSDEEILYIAEGIGCWKCIDPPAEGSTPIYLEDSVGIENLVSMQILVPPKNSRIHYVTQDRNVATRDWWQFRQYPVNIGVSNSVPLDHGGGIDYAAGNEDYLAVVSSQNGCCNVSKDGGKSWAPVAAVPQNVRATAPQPATRGTGFGGNIAVGSPGNLVWLPTGNNKPSVSSDHGATWAYCQFEGAEPDNFGMRWHNQYSYQRIQLLADKDRPGTFFLYHIGNELHDEVSRRFRGLWKSVDGGFNFERIRKDLIGPIFGTDAFNCKLKMPPGQSSHLFFCVGDVDANDIDADIGIFFSRDEGATWSRVGGLREPLDFAFGKPAANRDYPVIYAWGGLSGSRGLYCCTDFDPRRPGAAKWEMIGSYPDGSMDNGTVLAADMQEFGLVYLGLGGSGMFRAINEAALRIR